MKNTIIVFIVIIIVALGVWVFGGYFKKPVLPVTDTSSHSLQTITYSCDQKKTVTVTYIEGPEPAKPAPGEPPVPTGSAEVSLNGQATSTLHQTISADGTRYANEDESFVFWSKGNQVIIMRNNAMDLEYRNCVAN
ncbi:MAG: MliC family protein [Candidatus Paceibacterota bacterium]